MQYTAQDASNGGSEVSRKGLTAGAGNLALPATTHRYAALNLSVRELLATLAGIQETVLLYHDGGKGRPRARRMLTDMNPTQRQLADLFNIDRYAPTR